MKIDLFLLMAVFAMQRKKLEMRICHVYGFDLGDDINL